MNVHYIEQLWMANGNRTAKITQTLLDFSKLVVDLQDHIESIDLNPVLCSSAACVVADARIILRE